MPTPILMPALSPTMKEGKLTRWTKKEGDVVKSGDVIAEIETDKATMEVETIENGILAKIMVPEGTPGVLVNSAIAVILEKGEDASIIDDFVKGLSQIVAPKVEEIKEVVKVAPAPEPVVMNNPTQDRIFATPLARRIAAQTGVNLMQVTGSGPRGRIVKADLEGASFGSGPRIMPQKTTEIAMTTMRKVIADRLQYSKQTIPHFYLSIDVCVDELLATRKHLNDKFIDEKITVNDMIVKASALALIDVPAMNATYHDDHIKQYTNADVCVAVSINGGLITPIVSGANYKDLRTVSKDIKELAKKAKEGTLTAAEYQGGTFTISNLGMFNIDSFEAIINPPQVGILAVGGVRIVEGKQIMNLTLSADHRAVDGAVAAQFLQKLKGYLTTPVLMFV